MRKKITMLLTALLACVGVMKAEVNDELLSKKITVGADAEALTPGQWYVLYNHGRGACVSEETTAFKMRSTPTNDALAQDVAGMLFKLTAVEGEGKENQYYVVSGNGLYFNFVQNNTSAVSEDPVAYEIKTIDEKNPGHFYIKHAQHGWIADGQDIGYNFVCWETNTPTTVGGNNCYHFKPVTLTDVILVDVTYNYYVGNEKKHTEVVKNQIEGSAVSAPTFGFVSFTAITPTGTISALNNTFDITCELEDAPLAFSTVADPVWQTVEMHRYGSFRIWDYTGDELVSVTEMGNDKMGVVDDSKLWCFVGDHFGFKIYNKKADFDKTFNPTSGAPKMGQASGSDEWIFAKSTESQEENAVCFTSRNTTYMNRQGSGKIGYWGDADNGSTCYIYAPSEIVVPAAEELLESTRVSGVPAGAVGTCPSNLVESLDEAIKATNPTAIDDLISLSTISAQVNNAKITFGEGYYRLICVAPKTENNGDTNYNTLTYNGENNHLVTAPRDDKNINQVFEFVATDTEGKYYLQSPNAAKCLNNIAAGSYRAQLVERSSNEAGKLSVTPYNATQYKVVGNYPLCAENHPTEAVPYACAGWDGGANSPSAWYLVPISNEEMILCGFVAKVGTEYHATLQAAITAAEAEETIELINDITIEQAIAVNKRVNLNLNGKTVTRDGEGYAFEVTDGELVLEEGSINGGIHYIINDNTYKGKTYSMSAEKVNVDITYNRTFGHTNWQVLYVPFNIPIASMDKFDVYSITRVDNKKNAVVVEKITEGTLNAHTPYLIKALETGNKAITVEGATLMAAPQENKTWAFGDYTFTGTYAPMHISESAEYVLTNGEWRRLNNSNQTLGAFRVYLTVANNAAPVLRITTRGEEDTTAIDNAEFNAQPSAVIYDLLGCRVEKMDKGIYIVNGKKIVVK